MIIPVIKKDVPATRLPSERCAHPWRILPVVHPLASTAPHPRKKPPIRTIAYLFHNFGPWYFFHTEGIHSGA